MAEQQPPIQNTPNEVPVSHEQTAGSSFPPDWCKKLGDVCLSGACAQPEGCLLEQIEMRRQANHKTYAPPANIRQFLGQE